MSCTFALGLGVPRRLMILVLSTVDINGSSFDGKRGSERLCCVGLSVDTR